MELLHKILALTVGLILIAALVPISLNVLANVDLGGTTSYPGYDNYTVADVSVPPAGNNYSFSVNCLSELPTSVATWDFTVHITELVADVNDYTLSIHVDHGVNATNFGTWTLGTGDDTKHIFLTHAGVTTGTAVVYIYATDWNDSLVGEFVGTVTVQTDPTPTVTTGAVNPLLVMLLVMLIPILAIITLALFFVPKLW